MSVLIFLKVFLFLGVCKDAGPWPCLRFDCRPTKEITSNSMLMAFDLSRSNFTSYKIGFLAELLILFSEPDLLDLPD